MERAFKGVWIPKEIWLSTELSIQEKVILTEIDSLDNDEGCFASNKYFADFMNLSERQVKRMIKKLVEKGWIVSKLTYKKDSKEIEKRILKVNRPPYPEKRVVHKSASGVVTKTTLGVVTKMSKGGDKNVPDNNTNNNIYNNEQKQVLLEHFEMIWEQYPRKRGKAKALEYYFQWIRGRKISSFTKKLTDEQMYRAVIKYKKECEEQKTDMQFIKYGDTFFNKAILDYVEEENE